MTENELVNKFVKEISAQIPAWITANMPKSKPYELDFDDAEILLNAMVNFAAINGALIARSLSKRMNPIGANVYKAAFDETFFETMSRKCNLLFTKVFMQNMKEPEGI